MASRVPILPSGNGRSPLECLPNEVHNKILPQLAETSLVCLALVSRRLYYLVISFSKKKKLDHIINPVMRAHVRHPFHRTCSQQQSLMDILASWFPPEYRRCMSLGHKYVRGGKEDYVFCSSCIRAMGGSGQPRVSEEAATESGPVVGELITI